MKGPLSASDLHHRVRVLAILYAFTQTSLYPASITAIHTVNYFTDALAHIWRLKALDDLVLKKIGIPRSKNLQAAIDRLVGSGLIIPSSVHYIWADSAWTFDASFELNIELSGRVRSNLLVDDEWALEFHFINEITSAIAGLGAEALTGAVQVDASYSDPRLDVNSIVDLEPDGEMSRTAAVGARMAQIGEAQIGRRLGDSELTNLYVRHLYALLTNKTPL